MLDSSINKEGLCKVVYHGLDVTEEFMDEIIDLELELRTLEFHLAPDFPDFHVEHHEIEVSSCF
jgi:hypothetical protein